MTSPAVHGDDPLPLCRTGSGVLVSSSFQQQNPPLRWSIRVGHRFVGRLRSGIRVSHHHQCRVAGGGRCVAPTARPRWIERLQTSTGENNNNNVTTIPVTR